MWKSRARAGLELCLGEAGGLGGWSVSAITGPRAASLGPGCLQLGAAFEPPPALHAPENNRGHESKMTD